MKMVKFRLLKGNRPHIKELRKMRIEKVRGPPPPSFVPSGTPLPQTGSILVRLKKVKILNWNSRWKRKVSIYVFTTVLDETSKNPVSLDLKTFDHVKKGDELSLGKPGVAMYQKTGMLPGFLDMRILVARSKQGYRAAGDLLIEISKNKDYKNAVSELISIAGGPVSVLINKFDLIVGLIGAILKLQKDDQLLFYPATVTRDFDGYLPGLHCDIKRYVDFCYEIRLKG
jgi:hypothetical protein